MKINVFHSYHSASDYNIEQYKSMSPERRLEIIQILREEWIRLNNRKEDYHDCRAKLRRVCQIIKRI